MVETTERRALSMQLHHTTVAQAWSRTRCFPGSQSEPGDMVEFSVTYRLQAYMFLWRCQYLEYLVHKFCRWRIGQRWVEIKTRNIRVTIGQPFLANSLARHADG